MEALLMELGVIGVRAGYVGLRAKTLMKSIGFRGLGEIAPPSPSPRFYITSLLRI